MDVGGYLVLELGRNLGFVGHHAVLIRMQHQRTIV